MLQRIGIENFKSWQNLEGMRLAPVTVLFGANSSGKSSMLDFLLLLKQTKEATDRSLALDFGNPEKYADLGSFQDAIFNHDEQGSLSWRIDWRLPETISIIDPLESRRSVRFRGGEMSLEASVRLRKKNLETDCIRYSFSGQDFELSRKGIDDTAYNLNPTEGDFRFIRNPGRAWELPGPVKSYAFPDQAKTYYQNSAVLSDLELSYENLMDSIYYLGPVRDFPKRQYFWSGASPIDVGRRGERVVDAMLAARARGENRNRGHKKRYLPFDEFLAQWLQDIGLIYQFRIEEIGEDSHLFKVVVQTSTASSEVLITDVGFGVSQFLPVLVLLYYVPRKSIVLLEHSEIHLHPAVQSGLADVIINAVQTRDIQVILESHSEHLLRRLQRRIGEEILDPKDAAFYFYDMADGASRLTPLELDIFGNISNWPSGFFGDEFGEIAAMTRTAMERQKRIVS